MCASVAKQCISFAKESRKVSAEHIATHRQMGKSTKLLCLRALYEWQMQRQLSQRVSASRQPSAPPAYSSSPSPLADMDIEPVD